MTSNAAIWMHQGCMCTSPQSTGVTHAVTHAMRTMPAATSFWIFSMIIGDFRCACAALGFSWKSCSTCGEAPTHRGQKCHPYLNALQVATDMRIGSDKWGVHTPAAQQMHRNLNARASQSPSMADATL